MIDLAAEEAAGGHTIARHVGRTEEELRRRLAEEARLARASSFVDLVEAEDAVGATLAANAQTINDWAAGLGRRGAARDLELDHMMPHPIGRVVVRRDGQLVAASRVRVLLRRTGRSRHGWVVLTAYPTC